MKAILDIIAKLVNPEGVTNENWKGRLAYTIPIVTILLLGSILTTVIWKVVDSYGQASIDTVKGKDEVIYVKDQQIKRLEESVDILQGLIEDGEQTITIFREEHQRYLAKVIQLERSLTEKNLENSGLEDQVAKLKKALQLSEARIMELEKLVQEGKELLITKSE